MKQVISSRCAIAALMLVFGAFSYAAGQTSSATPDPFVTQLTSSTAGGQNNPFISFAGDISADGRFVVFESNGDVSTEKTSSRNNADGNREIFLADYAQRRIFQLTNTRNIQTPPPSPTPTPSPAASPTPTPAPTPADPNQIKIEISNNRPMISIEPALVAGNRVYTIVFSSNAPDPANFDGVETAALTADPNNGWNQEIWILQLRPVPDVADLSSGNDLPLLDLASGGTFDQITDTPPSRPLRTTIVPPDVVDDNREATISDDGRIIAFISTRNSSGTNADGNPELFFFNRTTSALTQATNTQDTFVGAKYVPRFQQNPSLSADGSRVAFLSTADLAGNNDDGNAEVYVADFTGSLSNVRQATRTKKDATGLTVNLLSLGRRLSRNGAMVAFESLAEDPKANSTTNKLFLAVFVYNVSADSFVQVGPRALASPGDIIHFPTFTDYNTLLSPETLVFASAQNFKPDGTFPAADQTATGLNPTNQPQIFAARLSPSPITFARLTNNPVGRFGGIRPLTSNTRERLAFSLAGSELGGGNADFSNEVFYLLSPAVTSSSAAALSFFAGASDFPVAAATPAPSPVPSPTPTPTPGTIALGLAAGELSIVRSTVALAPSDQTAVGGSETARSPILPIELNGVSVSVNGAAAGLYFVGDSPSEGIIFVMPIGLSTGVATVVINDNGTVFRGFVQVVPSQPDVFSSTNGPGGRAVVCNVTNSAVSGCLTEPPGGFPVTSPNSSGTLVPTVLEIHLTGVRSVAASEAKVAIGVVSINATLVRPNTNMFGYDFITITLPASLAGAGDVPLIVTVTKGGTFTSRAAATAPHITIH